LINPNLIESHPFNTKHFDNLIESIRCGFNKSNLTESHPDKVKQLDNLIESLFFGFNTPNLIESHPLIDRHENRRMVSLVVFNKPCLIESHPESLTTTGGVDEFPDFVQE
jgi:hypothetical protein